MHVADQLTETINQTGSVACVGLDPRPHLIPPSLINDAITKHGDSKEAVAAAFLAFNTSIIEAIAGHCAAIKPQVACYEAYGWQGMQCLEQSIALAKQHEIPVIVDGKRNDIGSTATHYEQAWLSQAPGLQETLLPGIGGDWLTINAYLGSDGVKPFLNENKTSGVFVLVKTSNPSSGEFQGQASGDGLIMDKMADLVREWGDDRIAACGLTDIGAVVGATWPAEAKALRERMPNSLFLVPGYGAQGGTAADALAGARADGTGILINSSRGIISAWKQAGHEDAGSAAKEALLAMNADLASARS